MHTREGQGIRFLSDGLFWLIHSQMALFVAGNAVVVPARQNNDIPAGRGDE